MEKATLKDLIAKKVQKENKQDRMLEVEVPSMGKSLIFKTPSDEMRLDLLDELGENAGTRKYIEMCKKIIYLCCDLLQNPELHQELGIVDPLDTVDAIFDLDDISEIGDKLLDAIGDPVEEIKNS